MELNRPSRGRAPIPEPRPEFPLDAEIPATFGEALRGLVDRPYLASQRWQQQQWRAVRVAERRDGVEYGAHPDLLEFERVFIKRMSRLGVPMFASEMIRTRERQDDLYALGNSKAKAGQSPHQYGCAVDVVHAIRGWNMSEKAWALIGHVGKELAAQKGLKLTWGGDWKFYDPAHWEIENWREEKEQFPWPMAK